MQELNEIGQSLIVEGVIKTKIEIEQVPKKRFKKSFAGEIDRSWNLKSRESDLIVPFHSASSREDSTVIECSICYPFSNLISAVHLFHNGREHVR